MADKETIESSGDGGLTRRDALVKAGVVTAGAVAAGSLAGSVKAAPKRRVAQAPRRGGRMTFALEQDPVHVAPFGAILTSNHWGKQAAYDSLVEWDRNLNVKPALAESWRIAADQKSITFNLRKGVRFHNGKELDAGDVKYSVEKMLNPPLPGSIATLGQIPSFDGVDVVSKYVARLRLKARDARVFGFLAWGRYSPIVPAGLYDQINVSRDAIGTGPYRMVGFDPNDKVEYVRNTALLEAGPAVHGGDDAEDASRRAGADRRAAGRCDRRRDALDRRRQRVQEQQRLHGSQGRHRRVPRVAVHDQGRPEAVARHPRPAGGQPRDQPAGDHQHASTAATATTPASSRPGTARGRSRRQS